MLEQLQLRWSGDLVQMEEQQLPKRLSYSGVIVGARCRGRQKNHYNDILKNRCGRSNCCRQGQNDSSQVMNSPE
ncbi:unnamed protein product [Dibothriocephalus latus]|uniref:Uncharacterized protein n=1 Tax=Dibothriocephalus latus TaxID=60516 RepID=A0A3P6UJL5_DIBLA|nr:unnamed protein product [Dibothriocephalus latus]